MKDGIRLVCLGAATPASDLVPKAVAMVDRLREVDEYGYQQCQVSDTQRIDVKLNGSHGTVWIWEGEGGESRCPGYFSGVTMDGVLVTRSDPDTGETQFGVRYFQPSEAYQQQTGMPAGWQVVSGMDAPAAEFAGTPAFTPLHGPGSWRQRGWAQISTLHASSYSGTMRHVVQILLGMSLSVSYQFGFYCTHGIWTNTVNGVRDDWLIEISMDRGVLAMRMPGCRASVPKENPLGYVPLGKTFPSGEALEVAIKEGSVRRLLWPDALEGFYARGPLYQDCGWAFSKSGRLASNTSTVPTTIYLNGTACNVASTRVDTISINGDETGPTAATITAGASGTAVGGGGNGALKCQLRVPIGGIPITWAPSLPSESLADYLSASAIVHCWYEGEDLKTVLMATDPANNDRPEDENPRPRPAGVAPYPAPASIGLYWLQKDEFYYQEYVEYPENVVSSNRRNRSMSSPVTGFARDQLSNYRSTYRGERTGFTFHQNGLDTWPFSNQVIPMAGVRVLSTTCFGRSVVYYDDVVIPPYEREGVIHYRYKTVQDAGPLTSKIESGILRGPAWNYKALDTTGWPPVMIYELVDYVDEPGGLHNVIFYNNNASPYPSTYLLGDSGAWGGGGFAGKPPNPWTFVNNVTSYYDFGGEVTLGNLKPYFETDVIPAPPKTATAQAEFSGSGNVRFSLSLDGDDANPAMIDNKWTRTNPSAIGGDITSLKVIRSSDGTQYVASANLATSAMIVKINTFYAPISPDANIWAVNFVGDA